MRQLKFKRLAIQSVTFIYTAQILLSSMAQAQQSPNDFQASEQIDSATVSQIAQSALQPLLSTQLSNEQRNLLSLEQMNAQNRLQELPTKIFGLLDQKVISLPEDRNQKNFDLNKGEYQSSKPAYTQLNYKFDNENQTFTVEGIAGADKHGRNGKVVAQHVFTGYDVATITADNLMIVIVEKNGNISAIPKQMFIELGFQAPVPVFRNLNGSQTINKLDANLKTSSRFISIAEKPLTADESKQALNLTANSDKNVDTGELHIWQINDKNERVNITRIPTLPILGLLSVGLKYMYAATQLTTYNPESAKDLEEILKEMYELKAESKLTELAQNLSEVEINFLSRFSSDQIVKTLSAAQHLTNSAQDQRVNLSLNQWASLHNEITENAQKALENKQKQQRLHDQKTQNLLTRIKDFFNKYEALDPEDYNVTSENYRQFLTKQHPTDLSYTSARQSILKKTKQILFSKIVTFTLIGAPLIGLYASSYAIESTEALKNSKAISYFYENVIPQVLKDHAYRGPLILSTLIQIALIPLIYGSAWALKAGVEKLANTYKDSTSPFGLFVKDFTNRYKPLTSSQVMLTINVRFFSLIVVPYYRVLIQGLLGQKNFLNAIESGVNPFKKITANSKVGKIAELTKDTRVGVNTPSYIKSKEERHSLQVAQEKLTQILREQNAKLNTLSWYLATVAISEKYGISPGDLFNASKIRTVTVATYSQIFADENLKSEAVLINEEIKKMLATSKKIDLEKLNSTINAEDFANLSKIAKDAAEKISSSSDLNIKARQNYLKFKSSVRAMSLWIVKLGEKQRAFLEQVYPSLYTTKQVNQDFPVDQLMVTVLPGLLGDQADLNKPNYLMADGSKLFKTSDAQINSIGMNIYGHLVGSAAAQTLIYDAISLEEETSYQPIESDRIVSTPQEQPLISAAIDWFKFAVLNPKKADIGGLLLKQYANRINTIFAAFSFNVIARSFITDMNTHQALTSFTAGFFLSHMVFGWPWGFIQAGNRFTGQQAEKNKQIILAAQTQIQKVLNKENFSEDELAQAMQKMVELYINNNPKKVKTVISTLQKISDPYIAQKIKEVFNSKEPITEKHFQYLGLITEMIVANKENNSSHYAESREKLIQALANNSQLNRADIQKLNAEGLIKLSQAIAPIHTAENSAITWITSIGFGAILTTVLASSLMPLLMDKEAISADGFLLNAATKFVEFTTAFYLAFGKTPWTYYEKAYAWVNEAIFKVHTNIPVFEKGFVQTLKDSLGSQYSRFTDNPVKQNELKYKNQSNAQNPTARSEAMMCSKLFAM